MDIHWRDTQRPVRFFSLDARSAIFILLFMVHIAAWTIILAITMMLIFWALERMGLTFSSALRAFRSFILGPVRPANHRRAVRYWIDFG